MVILPEMYSETGNCPYLIVDYLITINFSIKKFTKKFVYAINYSS